MTLLIAWLLIAGFDMTGWLYLVTFVAWLAHLQYHTP